MVEVELGAVFDGEGGVGQQGQRYVRPVGEGHGAGGGQGVPLADGIRLAGEQQGGPAPGLQPFRLRTVALEPPHPHRPMSGVQR